MMSVGSVLPPGVSIKPVVATLADHCGWETTTGQRKSGSEAGYTGGTVKRGRGIACSFKNVGFSFGAPEFCNAKITLVGQKSIEKAILYHSGAEVGQGSHTVFKQMAAEALKLPLEKIELVLGDTATSEYAGSVSASRMTFMAGNAIQGGGG